MANSEIRRRKPSKWVTVTTAILAVAMVLTLTTSLVAGF